MYRTSWTIARCPGFLGWTATALQGAERQMSLGEIPRVFAGTYGQTYSDYLGESSTTDPNSQ